LRFFPGLKIVFFDAKERSEGKGSGPTLSLGITNKTSVSEKLAEMVHLS
jgi:hypothetical protein